MFPNVIIAGAPKCGNTSLYRYLGDHRQVCSSSIRETRYFMDRSSPLINRETNYWIDGMAGYETFFTHCGSHDGAKIVLESTPDYLYQEISLSVFSGLRYKPRLIFILRKPSERVFSLFNIAKHRFSAFKRQFTFSEFVERILAKNSRFYEKYPIHADAVDKSKYAVYLRRWFSMYDRTRINVLLFEDMIKDPEGFMKNIAADLDIDPHFYSGYDYRVHNKTRPVRSYYLEKINRKFFSGYIRQTVHRFNLKPGPIEKTQADIDTIARLDALFSPYNKQLAHEFGIDTSKWESRVSEETVQ